jgi:hypothetical protein
MGISCYTCSGSQMSSPKIVLSFNEVMFYFSRAAVGVGLPYGLADDYGRSSIWIAAGGLDPAAFTSSALMSHDDSQSSLSASQTENGRETVLTCSGEKKKLSSLLAGPTVCDWISAKDTDSNKNQYFSAKNVDHPFLLAAAVGSLNSGSWEISWQDSRGTLYAVLTAEHGNWKTSWDTADISLMCSAADVTIRSVERSEFNANKWNGKKSYSGKNKDRVLQTGVQVYETWPIIHSFFSRCLVPSTDESRKSGAGAGLVETD